MEKLHIMQEFLSQIWWSQFVLGLIVLAVAKSIRFARPSWVRSYTTAGNYYLGLLAYFFFLGFIYFLLTEIVRRAALEAIKKDPPPPWLGEWIFLAPLLIVCALLLLSRFRPLSSLEAWFRNKLYDLIGYPGHAYRLAEVLFFSEYESPGKIETEVRSLLLSRGYDLDQKWLPVADPMRDLWFKAAILFHQIRNWESKKRYRKFLSNARVEFDSLRQRFDQLSFKVSRLFMTVERFGMLLPTAATVDKTADPVRNPDSMAVGPPEYQEASETVKTIISDLLSDLQEDVGFFLRNICLFMARGVLSNTLTSSRCFQRLKDLGFTVEMPCPSAMNVLLKAFIGFLICLAIPIAVSDPGIKGDFPYLFLIVMIPTVQVIALATAILPKRRYGFANEDIYGRPPWAFIIVAGLAALVLAALVSLGFRYLYFLDWSEALNDFSCNRPWLLMAFSTAAVSAFLIQDSRWASTSSLRAKRMKDALIMALSNSAMMVIVLLIFPAIIPDQCDVPNPVERMGWILPLPVGFSIGFLIGYIVPSAFRGQGSTKLAARPVAGSS